MSIQKQRTQTAVCSRIGRNTGKKYKRHYDFAKNYSTSDIDRVLGEWIHNDIYRQIIRCRMVDHMTYEQIAEVFNYSCETIKNVLYDNEEAIERELAKTK